MRYENLARSTEMDHERGRFGALARRHEAGTAPRAVVADQLFQTPVAVAHRMAEIAREGRPGAQRILEPSAGLGRLYVAAAPVFPCASFVLVESAPGCAGELYGLTEGREACTLRQGDFLGMSDLGSFDVVIMNPPFRRGLDVRHILHAASMLERGGLLVSLCYDGVKQGRKLRPLCRTWEPLPPGTFREAGTGAGVVLLTMEVTE